MRLSPLRPPAPVTANVGRVLYLDSTAIVSRFSSNISSNALLVSEALEGLLGGDKDSRTLLCALASAAACSCALNTNSAYRSGAESESALLESMDEGIKFWRCEGSSGSESDEDNGLSSMSEA